MRNTYEQLSARGLIGELHTRVAAKRPKVSRNTIHLAFYDATTPLRKMIVDIAEKLLSEHEAQTAVVDTE